MMTQNKISVAEALRMIDSGQSIKDHAIDFEKIKVEALDVMKLTKNGIDVPEEAIYYADDDIVEDDDFDGDWKIIDYDPLEEVATKREVKITVNKDVQSWLDKKNIKLDKLIENLLDGFYQSQKMIEEK